MTKAPAIKNVQVASYSGFLRWQIEWVHDGLRYHTHLKADCRTLEHLCLFKNPPRGTTHRAAGYFDTRTLNASAPRNALMIETAIHDAHIQSLFQLARDAEQRRIDETEASLKRYAADRDAILALCAKTEPTRADLIAVLRWVAPQNADDKVCEAVTAMLERLS